MKKVLFAASECVPFVKTGGLADVVGALPKEFDRSEWDIRVVLPDYTCIPPQYRDSFQYVCHFQMGMGSYIGERYVGVMQYEYQGITYYFIDNLEYFECFYPYGDTRYDIEKFIFFDKAVLSMLPLIDFQPDIIHCHDWQTGLIPVYLKTEFAGNPFFWGMKSVMTIHNLKFQGVWDIETIQGISGLPMELFTPDKLEFKKGANMLKGGLVYADYITTVSDTYAGEIQTPYYGEGLDGLLSARHFDMRGIVNGIDYAMYDPAKDDLIFKNYSASNFRTNKKVNKEKLQERLAKLAGGVAVIRVGAATETEMKEAKLRMEDALNATRAAVEEGIIAGGGSAYIHASKEVAKLAASLEGDEKTGAGIVLKALEAPLYHIAANAGLEGSVIINKVRESEVGVGFDALKEEYVDMVSAGILDPAKVTRSALQNATSVASTLLTTESVVANIKEDTPAMPAGGAGMGGMM